ncbi:MAG: alpha/beta hydrolase fold domain-containing protein [Planctomycetales bacterium]|nr:alpha/beta hydrolase fold domain-containing protein [Planctomycetales bacterium]
MLVEARHSRFGLPLLALSLVSLAAGRPAVAAPRVEKDLEFAQVDGQSLKLDLYLPEAEQPHLVVWIHGGGWRSGSKANCPLSWLAEHGYAVASISYRLSGVAKFPAQIHDCKGAVRWLRANAAKFGYRSDAIAVAGSSAGGHLAALMGTSADVKELEGDIGGHLDQSSRVAAVIDFYGATDFELRSQTQAHKTEIEGAVVYELLGGPVTKNLALARLASAATHVTADDPPFLAFHGDKDNKVLLNQSQRIEQVYRDAKLPLDLHVLAGSGHGGSEFYIGERRELMRAFLDQHLRGQPANSGTSLPRSTPEAQGVSSAHVRAFVEAADREIDTMHSFMLVRHGNVVAEGWWSPEAAERPHILWSLSKSFTSTAVGLAVAEGKLDIDDPVLKFFAADAPDEPAENLRSMRVRDLLTMSTGHEPIPRLTDDGVWTRQFLAQPVPHRPGSKFLYNTPATYM